jgi:hypothetical protein
MTFSFPPSASFQESIGDGHKKNNPLPHTIFSYQSLRLFPLNNPANKPLLLESRSTGSAGGLSRICYRSRAGIAQKPQQPQKTKQKGTDASERVPERDVSVPFLAKKSHDYPIVPQSMDRERLQGF